MAKQRGFTLIEALITTLILVSGLAAVAGVFSYSSVRSSQVLQQTAATALVSARMEDLIAAEELLSGRYSEYLALMPDGNAAISEPEVASYRRTWEITSGVPHRITVIVYGKAAGRRGLFRELARATTQIGSRF
jgi:prepilin-type N-terminal cleavage/methylation domain-containing protein